MAVTDQSTNDLTEGGVREHAAPNGRHAPDDSRRRGARALRSRNHGRVPPSAGGEPPRLAPGVELVGEFEGSGFKQPPMIARRADGQAVQLPALLYTVAEQIDGERDHEAIAQAA